MPNVPLIIAIDLYPSDTALVLHGQLYDNAIPPNPVGAAIAAGFRESALGQYEWIGAIDSAFVGEMRIYDAGNAYRTRAVIDMPRESIYQQTALIGAGQVAQTPANSGSVFDPVAAQTAVYWEYTFTALALVTDGWTRFTFTIKADPSLDDDSDALLTVRVSNPAAAGTDGIIIHNRAAVDAANALRTAAALAVISTNPDTIVKPMLGPAALVLPPSGSSSPYAFELDYWDAAGVKHQFGRGDFTLDRSVRRAIVSP